MAKKDEKGIDFKSKFKTAVVPNVDIRNERFQFREFSKKLDSLLKKKKHGDITEDDFKDLKEIFNTEVVKDTSIYEQPDCRLELSNLTRRWLKGEKQTGLKSEKFKKMEKSLDLFQPGLYLIGGDANVGKEISDVTPIPTPTGFKLNGDLVIGDSVFGRDGNPTKVTAIYPQGVKPIYRVTTVEGSYLDVGLDHLWYVETGMLDRKGSRRKGRILKTSELIENLRKPDGRPRFCIPRTEPVQFEKRNLLIKPYTMGALIGDGGFAHPLNVMFTNTDYEFVNRISEECEYPESVKGDGLQYRINRNGVEIGTREHLIRYGLWGKYSYEKHIPEDYLLSSVDDRIALLQGLMDSDGYICTDNNNSEYSTTSERLKDDIIQLVRSLGGRVSFTCRMGKYKKDGVHIETRINYRINIKFTNDINPFYISRKANVFKPAKKDMNYIDTIEYIGDFPATCITVEAEDHLYLGGTDFVVSHNTFLMQNLFFDFIESNPNSFGIMVSMDDMKETFYQRAISIFSKGKILINSVKNPGLHLGDTKVNFIDDQGREKSKFLLEIYDESIQKVMSLANDRFLAYDNSSVADFEALAFFIEKSILRHEGKDIFVMIDGLFNVEVEGADNEKSREVNIKRANLTKQIYDKHNIPVFASVELRKRDNKFGYIEPKLADIMESGKFAYNAKVVMMLCFNGDEEINLDDVYVKVKFVKNKISSFRGSHYISFGRNTGYITEVADRHKFEAQWKKEDSPKGFLNNAGSKKGAKDG